MNKELAVFPEKCPITGMPFFMTLETLDGEIVPTYGGPYDSYTIPVRLEDSKDEDCCWIRERYDHDEGGWVDAEALYDEDILPKHRRINPTK